MKLDEKIIAEKMIGQEPIITIEISSKTSEELIQVLNWYSYMTDDTNVDTWISDYMKKHNYDKKQIQYVNSCSINAAKRTLSSLCRMSTNGTLFTGELATIIPDKIAEFLSKKISIVEMNAQTNVISIQDRLKNIAQSHYFMVDEMIESWFFNKKTKIEFDMYNYLQKQQLNTQVSNLLRTHIIRSYFQEFEEMIQTDNEQLQEAYAYLSKSRKKTIYDALKLCISDIDRYIGNVKSAKPKSPKKKRPVSTEKQINSLKYQKEFTQLKIKSINPQQIIGAQQLWVYNTKYDQLSVYNAMNLNGLSIKGTTLQNFDASVSVKKKVRKPKDILPKVLDGGKIVLKRLMNDLTTKPLEINGRLSDDTILLRVIR
jgi:hypothetical protein